VKDKSEKIKEPKEPKKFEDTKWYDDLLILYQKKKIPELRNILWEQVRLLIYGRIRGFIDDWKFGLLKKDAELCAKLYQDAFFYFTKACDKWDPSFKTKFITFLGDCINQDILNNVRLYFYHLLRDKKIQQKIVDSGEDEKTESQEDFEKNELLEEVRVIFENYVFESKLERDIAYTIIYGTQGDWNRLQRKSKMSIDDFYKYRKSLLDKLKKHLEEKCSPRMKDVLQNMMEKQDD
jgi:DNA-directed RNA polymerase specialized sigma subunit